MPPLRFIALYVGGVLLLLALNAKYGDEPVGRIFFGAVALYLVLTGGYATYQGRRSASWPTHEGEMLKSEVHAIVPGTSRVSRYSVKLRYRYLVRKGWYEGTRRTFGWNEFRTENDAEECASQYPAGGKVDVYVNPANPREATLEVGMHWGYPAALAGGLVLLVVVVFFPNALMFFLRR